MLACDMGLERLYCGEWKEGYYFNENEVVEFNGGFFRSLVNENNAITSDERYWLEIINKNKIDERYELKDNSIVKDSTYTHTDNNFTTTEKDKLAEIDLPGILTSIENIVSILSSDNATLDELQEIVDFITQNKQILDTLSISSIAGLENALNTKQDALQSGVNISTINGENILNGENITITADGGIPVEEKGAPFGVAQLDEFGEVPASQLPDLDYMPLTSSGWTDTTAAIAVNTLYTNTTDKPIHIRVSARTVSAETNNNRFDIEINGVLLIGSYAYNTAADFQNSAIIFPGDTYKIVTALAPSEYTRYKVLTRT